MTGLASTRDETPVFVRAGDDDLFAILTRPTAEPTGAAAVLAWGAGAYVSSGRNQVVARLARRLAAAGYHAVRMDYRGVGESSGTPAPARLDHPPTGDVRAVCGWLHRQGLSPIVLVGSCYGAVTALGMVTAVDDLGGIALVGCPVGDEDHFQATARTKPLSWYAKQAARPAALRGLADPKTRKVYSQWVSAKIRGMARVRPSRLLPASRSPDGWVSQRFLKPVQQLIDSHTPLLFVYGSAEPFYGDFQQALDGRLGRLLERASAPATVRIIDTPSNVYASMASQEELLGVLDAWLCDLPAARGHGGSQGMSAGG